MRLFGTRFDNSYCEKPKKITFLVSTREVLTKEGWILLPALLCPGTHSCLSPIGIKFKQYHSNFCRISLNLDEGRSDRKTPSVPWGEKCFSVTLL